MAAAVAHTNGNEILSVAGPYNAAEVGDCIHTRVEAMQMPLAYPRAFMSPLVRQFIINDVLRRWPLLQRRRK